HDSAGLSRAVRCSLAMTGGIGLFAGLALIVSRPWIPHIYTDNPEVIALAAHLLLFAGIYQVSDALQVC
ncbi:MAG TPA: MATE family efflux transporter, partial [Alcanivorax sp.]|nr:MATE family efflux transporter [Alcanivorax sp.]